MHPLTTPPFALPERLAAKADPTLIGDDEQHLVAIAATLERTVEDLTERLAAARRAPGRSGQAALDRDQEVHRLTARLRVLRRFTLDLCLGRVVPADGSPPVYIGRLGLTDGADRRLLVDWRSPAAEPFFGATRADPMGLTSRRRYRWSGGQVVDYWDEVLASGDVTPSAALDADSAFLASLGSARSDRMQDVLGTLQADQDAIIRAGSRGALVVDGGPGTGKTVVALHRAAYLLYADPHLGRQHGGVLVVGPHQPYLAYVGDVLPRLGEDGVQTCTLRDLVPEGASAAPEPDADVARLKASAAMVAAIEPAVRFSERPPAEGLLVETPWADLWLSAADWAEAFDAPDPGTPHNEGRDVVWDAVLAILVDQVDDEEVPEDQLRRALTRSAGLTQAFNRAWPVVEASDLVGDLWSVPAYLRLCAPWLTPDEVRLLQRPDPQAWTVPDLPLLDAARQRLGDPETGRRRRRAEAAAAARRATMDRVVDDLVAADDSEMSVMSMLRVDDLRAALADDADLPAADPDALAGPFAHVVVDEAQELTDAEWQMLLLRCPSRSLTVVGDRAQARRGFPESWQDRLTRVGAGDARVAHLGINYRTPSEVMAAAEPEIRAALPDANVPTSVRSAGIPVRHGDASDLDLVVRTWLDAHADGVACVIGAPAFPERPRVRSLSAAEAKGLEFDLVVLVDPAALGAGAEGAVDRYVAMTRSTRELVVLTSS